MQHNINFRELDAAIRYPICPDQKSFDRLKEMYYDKDLKAILKGVQGKCGLYNDVWNEKPLPGEMAKQYVSKGGPSVFGVRSRVIETFDTNTSDFVDTDWAKAYRFVDLRGVASAELEDFRTLMTWAEISQGKKIEPGPYGDTGAMNLRERRYAIAVAFLERWLKTNQRHNINDAMAMMLVKNAEFKADEGYADIGSGSPATQTTTGSTPAEILTAINEAARKLLESLDTFGFSLSSSTRLIGYFKTTHRALVERARNQTRGDDGNNEVLFANIEFVYTVNSNFPTQFGGKNAGLLILPGQKNVWGQFEGLRSNSESDFRSDSVIASMQEYWNKMTQDEQKYIVNLEV